MATWKDRFWAAVEDRDPASMEVAQDIALEHGAKLWELGEEQAKAQWHFAGESLPLPRPGVHSVGVFVFHYNDEGEPLDSASIQWTIYSKPSGGGGRFEMSVRYAIGSSVWFREFIFADGDSLRSAQRGGAEVAWAGLYVMKNFVAEHGWNYKLEAALKAQIEETQLSDSGWGVIGAKGRRGGKFMPPIELVNPATKERPEGFLHFSTRPEPPQVPTRSVNAFSGGTGPYGVYAWLADSTPTFGAGREFSFELTPTAPLTHTRTYTVANLEHDLSELVDQPGYARAMRSWDKLADRGEPRNASLPFAKLWYVVGHLTDDPDPESWSSDQSAFLRPELGRRVLIQLGHRIIVDRLGVIYSSEPAQAVFLDNDSFIARQIMKRNPSGKPPRARDEDDAVAKYREFNSFDPKELVYGATFEMPKRAQLLGDAVSVQYRSRKVIPDNGVRPRGWIYYTHDHSKGCMTYAPDPHGDVEVPSFLIKSDALTLLGECVGFHWKNDEGEGEGIARAPYPELYTTANGRALFVIQNKRTVLAMSWGGRLGVEDRGIVG